METIYMQKKPHTDGTIGANGIYGSGVVTRYEIKKGRFPANLIHDGSDEVTNIFPNTKSNFRKSKANGKSSIWGSGESSATTSPDDSGSAARFFYCAKASKKDRNEGLDVRTEGQDEDDLFYQDENEGKVCTNNHPTVKPTDLMRYLCRLVTPPVER